MLDIQPADAELTLTLEGMLRAANDLATEKAGYVLDARQGKILDEKKLDKRQVLDHLDAETPGFALDARQGRRLHETKLGFADVIDALDTPDPSRPLSAAQGKWLNENKLGFGDVINDLETNEPARPLSAAQGAALGTALAALHQTVDALQSALSQKPDLVYQVGDIHITTSTQSPAAIYGGTWEQLKDRFLLAAGSAYAAGSTGGEAAHTLTENEMPRHYHDLAQQNTAATTKLGLWDSYIKSNYQVLDQVYDSTQNIKAYMYGTRSAGSGAAHNNLPPYLAVYMWRRVA